MKIICHQKLLIKLKKSGKWKGENNLSDSRIWTFLFSISVIYFFDTVYYSFGRGKIKLCKYDENCTIFSIFRLYFSFFIFLSFVWAYITSDFSVSLVIKNSHSLKPLIYKISGVWGNHEGSLLLWVLILAFYSSCGSLFWKEVAIKINGFSTCISRFNISCIY